jgi:hypothetical protein
MHMDVRMARGAWMRRSGDALERPALSCTGIVRMPWVQVMHMDVRMARGAWMRRSGDAQERRLEGEGNPLLLGEKVGMRGSVRNARGIRRVLTNR